jgi:hypothetical protein
MREWERARQHCVEDNTTCPMVDGESVIRFYGVYRRGIPHCPTIHLIDAFNLFQKGSLDLGKKGGKKKRN